MTSTNCVPFTFCLAINLLIIIRCSGHRNKIVVQCWIVRFSKSCNKVQSGRNMALLVFPCCFPTVQRKVGHITESTPQPVVEQKDRLVHRDSARSSHTHSGGNTPANCSVVLYCAALLPLLSSSSVVPVPRTTYLPENTRHAQPTAYVTFKCLDNCPLHRFPFL